jgi:hypothetical protein
VEFVNTWVAKLTPPLVDTWIAYPVIELPPLEDGAVHVTVARRAPFDADTPVGTPGVVTGVTDAEFDEYEPVPRALVAATLNRYDVPFVKLVTVADVDVDVPSPNVDHETPEFDEY